MRIALIIGLTALTAMFLLATGCGTTGTTAAPSVSGGGPCPQATPKIWKEWKDNPGEMDNEETGVLFFSAISQKAKDESVARRNAEENGRHQIRDYLGRLVAERLKRVTIEMGLSSEGLDPAMKGRRFEDEFAKELVQFAKVQQWDTYSYCVSESGSANWYYKVAALVKFPAKQAWEKQIADEKAKIAAQLKAETDERKQKMLNEAGQLLNAMDSDWKSLFEGK